MNLYPNDIVWEIILTLIHLKANIFFIERQTDQLLRPSFCEQLILFVNSKLKYTTQNMISITIDISIGLNPLTLDNCRRISSNSTKMSVVIENAVGYNFFYVNYSLDGPMDA